MEKTKKRRIRAAVAAFAALVVLAVGYVYWLAYQDYCVERECVAAQEAVAKAFFAIRDGDLNAVEAALYSGSTQLAVPRHAPHRWPRIVASTSKQSGLSSLSDAKICDSLKIARNQQIELKSSIMLRSVWPDAWRRLAKHPIDGVLVQADLPKHSLVVLCVKEHGRWKISGLPCISAKVMRYHTIDEASNHNDAIAW